MAGLWKVEGPKALPLLRGHMLQSESAIQKIPGEHGEAADFPRLLACVKHRFGQPGGCAALDAMQRLIERAGLKTEPWMGIRNSAQNAVLADRWRAWWEAHRETFTLSRKTE